MKTNLEKHKSKIYRSLLDMFLSNDDNREALKTPFIKYNYVYASNGIILICFEKSILTEIDFVSHEKAPDAFKVVPTDNIKLTLETAYCRNIVEKAKDEMAQKYVKKIDTCPDCDGLGVVDYEFQDHKNKTHEIEQDCPTCDGEGQIERIFKKENNEIVYDYINQLVSWQEALFALEYFEKIVEVAETVECSTIELVYRTNNTSVHKFRINDITIVISPVYQADEYDIVTVF